MLSAPPQFEQFAEGSIRTGKARPSALIHSESAITESCIVFFSLPAIGLTSKKTLFVLTPAASTI